MATMSSYRSDVSVEQRFSNPRASYYQGENAYGQHRSKNGQPQEIMRSGPGGRPDYDQRGQGYNDRMDYPPPQQQYGQNNEYSNHTPQQQPAHRYPDTFQNVDRPAQDRNSWGQYRQEQNAPTQRYRNEPQGGGRGEESQTYNNQYQQQYNNQQQRSATGDLDHNEFQHQNQSDFQGKNFYRGGDQRRENQSYKDNSRNNSRQEPRDWRDERGHTGPPARHDDQYWNRDQLQRQDDTRTSGGYRQYDELPQPVADYAPRQDPQDYLKYTNQTERVHQQYNTNVPVQNQYSDHGQPGYQEQRNRDFRSEGTRESVPLEPPLPPPQVVAETRGSTAVFGIVAKVEPPSRPPTVTSPTQQYGPPYKQYRDRQPSVEKPFQRLSQSNFQQKIPSPPLSPRQTVIRSQGPDSRWQNQRGNLNMPRQFGPENNTDRIENNRPYRDDQYGPGTNQPPYGSGQGYKAPHKQGQGFREQPPSRGNEEPPGNRIREEYQESSGYGSESTYLTDRSQRDANIKAYDDRPLSTRNDPYYDSRAPSQNWNPRQGDPQKMEPLRSPPSQTQRVRFQDAYQDPHKNPPSSARDMPYQRPGDVYDNQGWQGSFGEDRRAPEGDYRDYQHETHPPATHDKSMYNQNQYGQRQTDVPYQPQPRDYSSHHDINVPRGPNRLPPQDNRNPESRVEATHTKGVRAVKNMFEQKSDPRKPPPAPKPLISPKPNFGSNVNARPVPPRPRNLSDGGWQNRDNQGRFNSPQNPPALKSPSYDNRAPQYVGHQQNPQPSHSKSMENLDDRSGFSPPSHQQSIHAPYDNNRDQHGYRNSYSGEKDTRPMIIGVKYNQDNAPDDYRSNQPSQDTQNWKRTSWDRQNESRTQYNNTQQNHPTSPMRVGHDAPPRAENSSVRWKSESNINSQMQNNNRFDGRPSEQSYNHPLQPRNSNNTENYIPDIVARSYQALNTMSSQPLEQSRKDHYGSDFPPPIQSDLPPPPPQKWENDSGNRNSMERWPTPPPQVQQPPAQISDPSSKTYSQHRVDPGPSAYTDDWRRPGPMQNIHIRSDQDSQMQSRPPATRYPTQNPTLKIPPPPRQPFQDSDDDSSEGIDVDAPTPPPSKMNKPFRAPAYIHDNRSESPYERNKPVPVASRNLNPRSYGPPHSYQQQELTGEPASIQTGYEQQAAERPYQTSQQQKFNRQSASQPYKETRLQSPEIKSPPPTKPQRNSVNSNSPRAEQANAGEFDFDIGHTQVLNHASSRDKQRLGKSGALANRKPPSRQVGNDDDFQIEVTDNDLTHRATPIEVHREESMRVIRQKKLAASSQEKETSSRSDNASQLEIQTKGRNSQSGAVAKGENSSAHAPKTETKLLFKVPSTDVSKLETAHPIPIVTEPASNFKRRPPTYLGFGFTPEPNPKTKSKSDLLSQFKTARENAMRSAADKQGKAFKSVSAMVKFSQGAKNQKSPPKPKVSAADHNAAILEEMHIEVKPKDDHRHHRDDAKRSSTRSNSTVKVDKYDGDDDTTNGSRRAHNDRDKRGRGREKGNEDGRGKSRGRSRSRERDLSPEDRRARGRSRSRERALSPEHKGKSKTRDYDDRRVDDRRRNDDIEPPYYRRSYSPERRRYPPEERYSRSPQHYRNPHGTKEPDWVEQFRRGRERSSQPVRRAWVNDPRRVEVVPGGSRRRPMRELDMDAFERDVRNATAYNSDFEQPPEPRRQMLPSKFMAGQSRQRRGPPPGDWMNALKEKNRSAARSRLK